MAEKESANAGDYDAVIIGGGIAGLSSAFFLLQSNPECRVAVVERDDVLGGKIRTEHLDGFTIEGGPESFLSTKPGGVGLCRQLGLLAALEGPDPARQRTFVMRDAQLLPMPRGLSGLIPSRLGPIFRSSLLSPAGKLRFALELIIPAHLDSDDESLAQFVTRRFGREAYERLVEALMAGIYAGDGRQLSLDATFPQLRAAERRYGSVLRGIRASHTNTQSVPTAAHLPAFVTTPGGMSELVRALSARLERADVRTGCSVDGIATMQGSYALTIGGDKIRTASVIMATPAFEAARLLSRLNPKAADVLESIPYVSTATVSVGFRRQDVPHALDGYGYVIPRQEGREILACTWMSSKYPDRAPPSHVLLRAFVGRAGQEDAVSRSEAEIVGMVRQELSRSIGITASPTMQRVFRWPRAMPQPTLRHRERMSVLITRMAASPGIFLAGNAYQGIGIPDTIDSASAAAAAATSYLRDRARVAAEPSAAS